MDYESAVGRAVPCAPRRPVPPAVCGTQRTARHLFLCGTFEHRILLRLIAKYERQRKLLTFVPNTLGVTASADTTAERLLPGLLKEESSLFAEADQARQRGEALDSVDLARFVRDAVLIEGGDVRETAPDINELTLPSAWMPGLADTPGIDADTRTARPTTKLDITQDGQKREVGFLGRINSRAGREFEQVLAVLVRPASAHDGSPSPPSEAELSQYLFCWKTWVWPRASAWVIRAPDAALSWKCELVGASVLEQLFEA